MAKYDYDIAFERPLRIMRKQHRLVKMLNVSWRSTTAEVESRCRECLGSAINVSFHWQPKLEAYKPHSGVVYLEFDDKATREASQELLDGIEFCGRPAKVCKAHANTRKMQPAMKRQIAQEEAARLQQEAAADAAEPKPQDEAQENVDLPAETEAAVSPAPGDSISEEWQDDFSLPPFLERVVFNSDDSFDGIDSELEDRGD